ncbi:FAD-dependent oxidoreductase [Thermodesulfobacteriota bacterium]
MQRMFKEYSLDKLVLKNRFLYPPMKTGFSTPKSNATPELLQYYEQIAKDGPAIITSEPYTVSDTARETPKQLGEDRSGMEEELKKIVDVVHKAGRLMSLHLNHAGASAPPNLIGQNPISAADIKCLQRGGIQARAATEEDIQKILEGYRSSAQKSAAAGCDLVEVQMGHGYLVHQFLNPKINKRTDRYGWDRMLLAKEVLAAVKEGAPGMPVIVRISGNDMSDEWGVSQEKDLKPLLDFLESEGITAIHASMGTACFSVAWYLHHPALPEKPQLDAMEWVRKNTSVPLIVAGRMDNPEKIEKYLDEGFADIIALGRALIADPDIVRKWKNGKYDEVRPCGYCLQGCQHRLTTGRPSGCNINPLLGQPELGTSSNPVRVLVVGGGPAGISTAVYMSRKGHEVILAEKENYLGGQYAIAWQAPGKSSMKNGLDYMIRELNESNATVMMNKAVDVDLVKEVEPDLLVWATGASQNIPSNIENLESQYSMTSLEYFRGDKEIKGSRVLVIGAGKTGVEIAEILGAEGFDVVATKRTDPVGSGMFPVSLNIILKKIESMPNVNIMPHTRVLRFNEDNVIVEQDGEEKTLKSFDTVILSSGMVSNPEPEEAIKNAVSKIEIIGDANDINDIFAAVTDGYHLACEY